MPFFSNIDDKDKVPDAFQKFNVGFERTILALTQKIVRGADSELTVGQRELIAAFVSGTNACSYCAGAHGAAAVEFGIEEGLLTALLEDIDTTDVDEKLKPIFKFVKKLTREPAKMTQADADAVLAMGWSERALYDAIAVCCLFNFMNRYVDGIGLNTIPEQFSFEGKMLKMGYDMADVLGLK